MLWRSRTTVSGWRRRRWCERRARNAKRNLPSRWMRDTICTPTQNRKSLRQHRGRTCGDEARDRYRFAEGTARRDPAGDFGGTGGTVCARRGAERNSKRTRDKDSVMREAHTKIVSREKLRALLEEARRKG